MLDIVLYFYGGINWSRINLHIEAAIKWTPFRRRYFQMHFLEWNWFKFQHWFRYWLGAVQATSHYLNQWWSVYRRIYASLGLNELRVICGKDFAVGFLVAVDPPDIVSHKLHEAYSVHVITREIAILGFVVCTAVFNFLRPFIDTYLYIKALTH